MSWEPPPCPLLPAGPADMTAAALTELGTCRDGRFYATALAYAGVLWKRGMAARAILCVDRALGADLRGDEPELKAWPLPYATLVWILKHTPPGVFIGNPRVHYQHLADRMNEPRREQRRWRAWGCWLLTRTTRPEFDADPRHRVIEPHSTAVLENLARHGIAGEAELWRRTMEDAR